MATKKKTTKKSGTKGSVEAAKPKPAPKAKAAREHIAAQAKADQENARLRDERTASADGMAASERAMATSAKDAKGKKKAEAKAAKPKKVSALDAAAQVLAGSKEPMRAQQLIDEMTKRGLWTSPGGKTPAATLYAAMTREISTKGAEARFKKTDRGLFVANG